MGKDDNDKKPELTGFRSRVAQRYPDDDLPTDDAGWESAYERYGTDVEADIGRYKGAVEKLNEMCAANPEFAEFIHCLVDLKMPFRAAIASIFSQEDLIPQDGDEDYDAFRKAYDDRLSKAKKRDEQGREINENEQKSLVEIDRFCKEKGLSDEKRDELIGIINDHFTELIYKRISPQMLEGFLKQMTFDTAVAEADKTGEIRGRNQQIEAKRSQGRETLNGDGLPGAGGGGNISQTDVAGQKNFFDLPYRKSI